MRLTVFAGIGCLMLQATGPALDREAIWAAHDVRVLASSPAVPRVEASASQVFTGKAGRPVRGWDVGDPKGPVVLWWTGGPGEQVDAARLSAVYGDGGRMRLLVLEQPGTGSGQSAWVPGWRPEDSADDAETFLRLRGVQGPVLVAGWSWGSTMALCFAQRHPERAKGVAVGGVWGNSPEEVAYYLGAEGTRALMPGMEETFNTAGRDACDLHQAIAKGQGGMELAGAYASAEGVQARLDSPLRKPALPRMPGTPGTPVDMGSEGSPLRRFAYIESEMMCRGQRGQWSLPMSFPSALAKVPLVVLQGRYDQVCDPQVAVKVWRAWPGKDKVLVPFNGGHSRAPELPREVLAQAGVDLSQAAAVQKALRLHFGHTNHLMAAALGCLAR